MRRSCALLLGLALLAQAPRAAASIVINLATTYADAAEGVAFVFDSSPSLTGDVVDATLPMYVSTTTTSYSVVGDTALFAATFDHARGAAGGFMQGLASVRFTPTVADLQYDVSGVFSNPNGDTALLAILTDITMASSTVFVSHQASVNATAVFIIGELAGNTANDLVGSTTGPLLKGHEYEWLVGASSVSPTGASSVGDVIFQIGPAQAVPELPSVAVWSLLGLLLGGAVWARR